MRQPALRHEVNDLRGRGVTRSQASAAVDAIVVAFRSAGVLEPCLSALAAQGASLIVVDNASADGSDRIAAELGARVVRLERNEGFGRGCNAGAAIASAPFLLFVNPDCVLAPGAVAALLAAAERYPDAAFFAPRLTDATGAPIFGFGTSVAPYLAIGAMRPPDGDCCLGGASGAAFLVRRAAFEAVGGFDPNIFLYFEDDDLTRRLIDAGGSLVYVHAAVAVHAHGRSTPSSPAVEALKKWHLAWSRCYVLAKHGRTPPAWHMVARDGLKALVALLSLRWGRAQRNAAGAAGAWAWMRGRTALERQGLDRVTPTSGAPLRRQS